jgi:hypothetical protein
MAYTLFFDLFEPVSWKHKLCGAYPVDPIARWHKGVLSMSVLHSLSFRHAQVTLFGDHFVIEKIGRSSRDCNGARVVMDDSCSIRTRADNLPFDSLSPGSACALRAST